MIHSPSNNVVLNIEESKENSNNNLVINDEKLSESFEIEMNNIDMEVDKKYEEITKKHNCPPVNYNLYCYISYEYICILCFFIFLFILIGLRAGGLF